MSGAFQRFLHPGDDQHLLGRALHTARGVQILGDSLTKRTVSQSLAPGQQLCGGAAQTARGDLRPKSRRKSIKCGQVGAKGAGDARFTAAKQLQAPRVRRPSHASRSRTSSSAGAGYLQEIVGKHLADIGPGADLALNVALRLQLLECGHHAWPARAGIPGPGLALRADVLRARCGRPEWRNAVRHRTSGRAAFPTRAPKGSKEEMWPAWAWAQSLAVGHWSLAKKLAGFTVRRVLGLLPTTNDQGPTTKLVCTE